MKCSHILRQNGKLYFSSNGHMGMGGLDIFTATLENNVRTNVTNLKYPINSSWDDFEMMFNTATTGYLTSNVMADKVRMIFILCSSSRQLLQFMVECMIPIQRANFRATVEETMVHSFR